MKQKLKQNRINWLVWVFVGTLGLSLLLPQGAAAAGTVSSLYSTISVDSSSIKAGSSGATVTLQLRDDEENLLEGQSENIALTSSRGTDDTIGDISEDGSGVYTATITSIAAGTATITAKVGATLIGTADIAFNAGDASSSQSTVEVSGSPVKIDGSSGATIIVTLKDGYGNAISDENGLAFSGSRGTVDTIGDISEDDSGVYTATITSTTAGMATIMAKVGSTTIGTAVVTFTAGDASTGKSTLTVDSRSIIANGTSTATVTVQLIDAYGNNLASQSDKTVKISCTGGTISGTNYTTDCQYRAAITSSTTAGGPYTISATLDGTAIGATQTITFIPGEASANKSTLMVDNSSIIANGTSTATVTVQLSDAYGNNLASQSDKTVKISCTGGTVSDTSYLADGQYQATITSTTIAGGTYTISATLDGTTISTTKTLRFVPGPASTATSTISAALSSIPVGGTSTTITVRLIDQYGNYRTSGGDTVTIEASDGTIGTIADKNNGTYTASLTSSTTSGTVIVKAKIGADYFDKTATVVFSAGGASTNTSTIKAADSSLTADGTSKTKITIQLKDGYSNILSEGGVTITLEANPFGVIDSQATDNGDGTYTAYLTSFTAAGTVTVSGKINGVSLSDTETVYFAAGAASATTSTITAADDSIAVGGATTTIIVQLKDKYGNNLTDNSAGYNVTLATSWGTIDTEATYQKDGYFTAALISGTPVGTATISGKLVASGISTTMSETTTVKYVAGAASATTSTVSATLNSIQVGGSSTVITVQLKDQYGNVLDSSGGTVTISTNLGTLSAVTDQGTGKYTATLTTGTQSGTATISAYLGGILFTDNTAGTATVTFTPGVAVKSASTITAADRSLTADGSTTTITVQLKDMYGNNLTNNSAGNTVTLSTSLGSIGAASYQTDGYFIATLKSATSTGTATIKGYLNSTEMVDTETVTYTPGPAVAGKSVISVNPTWVEVGGNKTALTVQLKDQYGNKLTTGDGMVTLTANLNGSAISAGTVDGITNNHDGTYTAFYLSAETVGTVTVSGIFEEEEIGTAATITLTPGSASAATSTINAGHTSISDGGASTKITVQLKDQFGNDLESSGGPVTMTASEGTLSTVIDNGDGTYVATLTSSTTAGVITVSGKLGSASLSDTALVDVSIGVASAVTSTITAASSWLSTDGASTTIMVKLKDVYGNALTTGGDNVTLSTSSGTITTVTDQGNGTYTATLTAGTAAMENVIITGRLKVDGTMAAMDHTAAVSFTPGAASGATSTITAGQSSAVVGGNTLNLRVQLCDQHSNKLWISGDTVTLTSSGGTIRSIANNGDGTYTAVLESSTVAGSVTISGIINASITMTDTETVVFTPGTAYAANSTISASPGSIQVGGKNSTITVQLYDEYGNKLIAGGDTVELATSGGYLSHVTDQNNGAYTATLTSLVISGTFTVGGTVKDSGTSIAIAIGTPATVTFTAADPTAASSTVSAADSAITADGISTTVITVQLKDQYGNNLTFSGGTVTMTTTAGMLSAVTDKNDGSYTATLTSSTHLETATIYASLNGMLISRSVTVDFTVGTASAATSLITASPYWIKADGSATSTITVQLRDAQGHYLTGSGGAVTLTTTAGTLSSNTMNYNSATNIYTAIITSSGTSGTATIHAFIDGKEMDNSTTVTFYGEGGGGTVTISLSASPASITADGASTSTITAQYGTTGGKTVTLTTTAGTLSSVSDNGDGTYTAILTASTTVETATIGMKVNGVFYSNTATVNFVAGETSADTSLITADKTSITANGNASAMITMELRDVYGNAATTSGTVALSTTLGSLGSVTKNADGTYSTVLTAGTQSGTAVVSGTITFSDSSVITLSNKATVYFTPGAVSLSTSTITASSSVIQAGGANTTITVQLKDTYGNNLTSGAGTVYLRVTDGSLSTVVDKNNGTYLSTLTSASKVETVTVSGSIRVAGESEETVLTDTETVDYTVGTASVNTTTITPAKKSISAGGGTTIITIQLIDAYGNLLSTDGAMVALTTSAGSITTPVYAGNGTYMATLTAAGTVGTATISGTLVLSGGSAEAITATATVKFIPAKASPVASTISVDKPSVTVGGSIATITIKLKDEYGNDLSSGGDEVTFTPSDWIVQDNTVNDAGNGTYTATLVSSDTAGIVTIQGYINGTAMTHTASIKFLPGAADKDKSTITAAASSLTVGGSSTTITVQLIDKYNNKLTGSGGTVTLTQSSGASSSLSTVTDKGDGTYTATLTSSITVGSTTISGTVTPTGTANALTIADTAAVSFTIGTPSVKTSTISASPATLTVGSSETAMITIQLADQFGNLWTASGINSSNSKVTVTISASNGAVDAVTDVGDGTYTARLTPSTTAGTVTIYGKIDGTQMVNTATVTFTPGPASPPRTVISASPSSITANGNSTSTITVQLRDQYGNNLASNDAGNVIVLYTTLGAAGSATYQKNGYFTAVLTSATTTSTATITGTLNGTAITDSETVSFTPGSVVAANAVITAATSSIQVGGATTKITVQMKDQYGNNLTASAGTVILSTTAGAISAAVDQLDGTYIATLTSSTKVETAVISGTLNGGVISDSEMVSFTAGSATATKSVILASPTTIIADGNSTTTITVQLVDSYGNYLSDKTGVSSITLASTLGTITSPIYQNNGTYRAVVTSSTGAGTATVSGTLNSTVMSNTVTLSFVAGVAAGGYSTISASPTEIKADGTSTSTITVQLKDRYGNKLTDSSNYLVALVETIGADNNSITATNKNDGTFTATIKAPTSVGAATISGTLSGTSITTQSITNTATVKFIVGSATQANSTITGSPGSITANGTSTSTITVQLKDAHGNNLTTSGGTVTLSTNAGSLTTVKDNSNGTYTATLASTTTAQTVTINGKLNGTTMTNTGTVYFVAGAVSAAKSTISISPASVTADGSTAAMIAVQLKDAYGNSLTTATDSVVLTSSRGSSDTITQASYTNGVYRALITSTLAGTATISGTINGSAITSGNATVTFTAGAVSMVNSTLTVSPTSIRADGSTTATITVQLKDSHGNALTSTSNTVVVSSSRGSNDIITQVSYTSGVYKATIKSTVAGTATISGIINGSIITSGDATVTFTPGTASAVKSTISVSPSSVKIDGTTMATITVQLKDAYGNNLISSGDTVTLSSSRGSNDAIGTVTYITGGIYTATILSTVAGTATVSGKLNGISISSGDATVTFTPGTASAIKSTISISPSSVKIDGTTTAAITVQLKDAYGNNLISSGDTVTLSSNRDGNDTIGTVNYITGGIYMATILSSVAGTATVSGKVNGISISSGNATVTFTPGTASAIKSTISVSPSSVKIDGTTKATITVQLKDAYGNNLISSGDTVTLSSSRGSSDTIGAVVYTMDGAYTAAILSTKEGTAIIRGQINGSKITTGDPTVTFTTGDASAATSKITIDNSSITANGSSTATVTVQLIDAYGNNLNTSGGVVEISCPSAVSTGAKVSDTSELGNGQYQAMITSSTKAGGPYTISAALDGAVLAATVSVTFKPDTAVIGKSTITVNPGFITADGSSTAIVTVQLIDTHGNKLTSSGGVVQISCEAGTVSATTDNSDGTYQAMITSSTKAGEYKISATLAGVSLTATARITFTPGVAVVGKSTLTISKNHILADGTSTARVTVQLIDANDNQLTSDGGTVVIASPEAIAKGATISETSYVGNGQYQAIIRSSSEISGPFVVSATLNNTALAESTLISFVAGPVMISTKITGNQLIVQVDNLAYTDMRLTIDGGAAIDKTAADGVTTFTLPTDIGIYTLKIWVYYALTDGSCVYSDPKIVFYTVRPKYIPGKGDGFGWEMWK